MNCLKSAPLDLQNLAPGLKSGLEMSMEEKKTLRGEMEVPLDFPFDFPGIQPVDGMLGQGAKLDLPVAGDCAQVLKEAILRLRMPEWEGRPVDADIGFADKAFPSLKADRGWMRCSWLLWRSDASKLGIVKGHFRPGGSRSRKETEPCPFRPTPENEAFVRRLFEVLGVPCTVMQRPSLLPGDHLYEHYKRDGRLEQMLKHTARMFTEASPAFRKEWPDAKPFDSAVYGYYQFACLECEVGFEKFCRGMWEILRERNAAVCDMSVFLNFMSFDPDAGAQDYPKEPWLKLMSGMRKAAQDFKAKLLLPFCQLRFTSFEGMALLPRICPKGEEAPFFVKVPGQAKALKGIETALVISRAGCQFGVQSKKEINAEAQKLLEEYCGAKLEVAKKGRK